MNLPGPASAASSAGGRLRPSSWSSSSRRRCSSASRSSTSRRTRTATWKPRPRRRRTTRSTRSCSAAKAWSYSSSVPDDKTVVDLFTPANVAQLKEAEAQLGNSDAIQSVVSPLTLLTWTQDLITKGVASEILSRTIEREPDAAAKGSGSRTRSSRSPRRCRRGAVVRQPRVGQVPGLQQRGLHDRRGRPARGASR